MEGRRVGGGGSFGPYSDPNAWSSGFQWGGAGTLCTRERPSWAKESKAMQSGPMKTFSEMEGPARGLRKSVGAGHVLGKLSLQPPRTCDEPIEEVGKAFGVYTPGSNKNERPFKLTRVLALLP